MTGPAAPTAPAAIRWVVLDVGGTILDETGLWSAWAARLGVRPLTLHAAMGVVIDRGGHHREALSMVRPGLRSEDFVAGCEWIDEAALYDDVRPALAALRALGVRVAVGGHQSRTAIELVRDLALDVDELFSSAALGAEKPTPEYYALLLELLGARPGEVLHVGDRLDNDVAPAAAAGLVSVWLRRGPWALLQAPRLLHVVRPEHAVDSLLELPGVVARLSTDCGRDGIEGS